MLLNKSIDVEERTKLIFGRKVLEIFWNILGMKKCGQIIPRQIGLRLTLCIHIPNILHK
jgi:hypothetical protein